MLKASPGLLPGTQTVLRDFSLDVEPGAFVVDHRPVRSCGKTTVLKLANGLSPDTQAES